MAHPSFDPAEFDLAEDADPEAARLDLLTRLPDDATPKDVQYHVYVLEKMKHGLASADAGPSISQEAMEAELERWLDERIDWSA